MEHEKFLKEALKLARRGEGLVSPNPMVGAVITRGSQVVGRGWHRAYGLAHAEIEALKEAGPKARGGRLYVTLEPCCHHGKTPPCVPAIVASGIKEVFCCMADPNPLMQGKGFKLLEQNGVRVRVGWQEREAMALNQAYLTRMNQQRPYLILKWAMTLDGKIAMASGDAAWVTGEESRNWVRSFRFTCDAVLVGINTVLRDDPQLSYRPPRFQTQQALLQRKRYFKVILDSQLRTPRQARIFSDPACRVLIFTSEQAPEAKVRELAGENCLVRRVSRQGSFLNLKEILQHLLKLEVGIVLVEGGSQVLTSFYQEQLADKLLVFVGNKIAGSQGAIAPLRGPDRKTLEPAPCLSQVNLKRFGNDFLIEGQLCFPES